jgi:hypothetical protein
MIIMSIDYLGARSLRARGLGVFRLRQDREGPDIRKLDT